MTTDRFRYAYLHGFTSGPRSMKGTHLKQGLAAAGIHVELPDLNAPSLARVTISSSLEVLDRLDGAPEVQPPWRLIGSSFGGYLAALWAARNPTRVDRLLLLCPGFDLVRRWPEILGQDAMERWRTTGWFPFALVRGGSIDIHHGFVEDAARHEPFPEVPCRTRIIHGTRDEVVPVETSVDYATTRTHVEVTLTDDVHALTASLDLIDRETLAFFEIAP